MKRLNVLLGVSLLLTISCGSKTVKQEIDLSKPHLKINVGFNAEAYKSLFFKKLYPTYVIWAVNKKTDEVRTIYITGKAGTGEWMMADERPSSVPVWYGVKKMEAETPVDSISGATPSGEMFTHYWQIPGSMMNARMDIYLEVNVSFDYNEFYREEAKEGEPGYSDVNGQPSLIWMATLETGKKGITVTPKLISHGHVLGKNHDIDKDLSKVTTAKTIFRHVDISYIAGSR